MDSIPKTRENEGEKRRPGIRRYSDQGNETKAWETVVGEILKFGDV